MNLKGLFYPFILAGLMLSSCIQDEALNAECDIVSATLQNDDLKGEPIIENDRITFLAKPYIDVTELAPEFELTEGATIDPASGTTRDFTTPQKYTVTSQDGQWSKTYTVSVNMDEIKTKYSFEHYELKDSVSDKYFVFYEQGATEKNYIWATGNPGYKISNGQAPADSYPTLVEKEGVSGSAVKLVTRSTGALGNLVKMPIAAGNLFIGTFDATNAIKDALKATKFGTPFTHWPIRLKGWYKYTPGEVFTNRNNQVEERTDEFDIYAVFYEPTPEKPYLTGDNILTDESIIAIARVQDRSEKKDYTEFNIPFEYKANKEISEEKLKNYKYNLTLVFSSSIDGAFFQGAVGSTLVVDEVELIFDNN